MACLTRHYATAVDDLPMRILSEFEYQPGLRLTFSQARRLWDLQESACGEALAYLVRCRLLRRDAQGQYCLAGMTERTPWIYS